MLCSKFKQIAIHKSTLHNKVQIRYLITSRDILKKWVWIDGLLASVTKSEKAIMSPIRIIIKDLRIWSIWTRRNIVSTVIRRCSKERGVREVIQCFRQAFHRPKRTFLISATAAYKARDDNDDTRSSCDKSITEAELQELLKDMDAVEMLSRQTLFCSNCGMRLVIDKKQPGVRYCSCKPVQGSDKSDKSESAEGWVPYMEAEDVIIWRKEYKPGLGLYAYKVYGRYPDVRAADFAAIQVDCHYRRVWDAAVAALAVVERDANGLPDQAVLHWEVLWPRLFANRDYVYIRRHKSFDVTGQSLPHRAGLFQAPSSPQACAPVYTERPSVHSKAKRKAMEMIDNDKNGGGSDNKAYVIVNRSCSHPQAPETRHAIRVSEYWSHMVVKSMHGPDKSGMEFVLTYYDEPAVGGMPSSVAAWATGRAAPAYLARMRRAAADYRAWAQQETPDFTPFVSQDKSQPCQEVITVGQDPEVATINQDKEVATINPDKEVTTINQEKEEVTPAKEQKETKEVQPAEVVQDTEVSKPSSDEDREEFEIFGYEDPALKPVETRDQATQTEDVEDGGKKRTSKKHKHKSRGTEDKSSSTERDVANEPVQTEGDSPKPAEEGEPKNGGWWRYIYPFYYFV